MKFEQIGWYNESVQEPFKLPYNDHALAALFISRPDMFEKTFLPFFVKNYVSEKGKGNLENDGLSFDRKKVTSKLVTNNHVSFTPRPFLRDPIDECMKKYFAEVKQDIECKPESFFLDSSRPSLLSSLSSSSSFSSGQTVVHSFFDFDMNAFRRPSILMQTAGHVSGAAFYYRGDDVVRQLQKQQEKSLQDSKDEEEEISESSREVLSTGRRLWGVSLHPQFGGWFAFRCVMLFPEVMTDKEWRQQPPPDVVPDLKDKLSLLISFNDDWRSAKYRDFIPVQQKYSLLQKQYFDTKPGKDRLQLLLNHLLSLESPSTSSSSSLTSKQIMCKQENEKIQ